jgi:hypothetical protein
VPILGIKTTQETHVPIVVYLVHIWGIDASCLLNPAYDRSLRASASLESLASSPTSLCLHMVCKWCASSSANTSPLPASATLSSSSPSSWLKRSSHVCLWHWDIQQLNRWDIELSLASVACMGGWAELHSCHLVHHGGLVCCQLVDCCRDL